ncbi:hypothetical protein MJ904_07410 [Massilia sp. MB5]|uniref:hypothetical protein n=1 Tax=Massilia sp. MB5 TaxID=2919578 RepID=UPI001F10022A|nr:hypothetical protein [Massilia sp. MB5]UMR31994.1 hypothetical protein MJ904_07410 [Massilia sp. MB5]
MLELVEDFSDERNKAWCIHCTASLAGSETNWDHVPTKSLLERPLPAHVPQVEVCRSCNTGFSLDEEYLATFLSCVLSGSTEPAAQINPRIARALARNPSLQAKLELSRKIVRDSERRTQIVWDPEMDRINRVVVKNARGHAFFEFGEPMMDEPAHVWASPLELLSEEQRAQFENVAAYGWPEVGSRMMTRLAAGVDMEDGWVVVQDDVYRYAVVQEGTLLVRSVIRNYLATEVFWE